MIGMYRSNHRERGTSASLTFVLIAETCTEKSRGRVSPDRPSTQPGSRIHTRTNTQWYSGQSVWARTQRVALSASRTDEWVSDKPNTGVQWQSVGVFFCLFFSFQGAKHLMVHTATWILSFYILKKGGWGSPVVFTYIHKYPNNLNLFEEEI